MGILPPGDGLDVEVHLRRHSRARAMTLRVSSLDGRVTLTLPRRAALREARAFLRAKRGWISDAVARAEGPITVEPGLAIPVEGRARLITLVGSGRPRIDGDRLCVAGPRPGPRVEAFLRALARERVTAAIDAHAARLGRTPTRISLRDTRSRWGSCTCGGALMVQWRLIMAPPFVLDYVAAHEVAHLAHLDHSPAFWAATRQLCGDPAPAQDWLRREGPVLHRWRFRDD